LGFDHASVFDLGIHSSQPCESCHAGPSGSQVDCESCHQKPAQHLTGADASCYLCHTSAAWKPAAYPHVGVKSLGAHTDGFLCGSCHESQDLRAASVRCQPCHDRPTSHPQTGVGECVLCHQPGAWKPAKYDHKTFVSLGKHSAAVCGACHTDGIAFAAQVQCALCHTTPEGHTPGITDGCQKCHSPGYWKPATVPHYGFTLTGRHVTVQCADCHADGVFAGRSESCSSCHKKPAGHVAGVPETCDACRRPTITPSSRWLVSTFRSHAPRATPMVGMPVGQRTAPPATALRLGTCRASAAPANAAMHRPAGSRST
jgi:hypothetical protein